MRVTNVATFRNMTSSVNDLHGKLVKSYNKINSERAYESAAENPLAYYEGLNLDDQYQDIVTKQTVLKDVQHRLSQQEQGVRTIQQLLSYDQSTSDGMGVSATLLKIQNATNKTPGTLEPLQSDLMQKMHGMVDALNSQYAGSYVFGGNDMETCPFTLSDDGMTLTYTHRFPNGKNESIALTLKEDPANPGNYTYNISDDDMNKIIQAMSEQGPVDVGYGYIGDRSTLLDTFVGGLNVLTGMTSQEVRTKAISDPDGLKDDILAGLNSSPLALAGKGVAEVQNYLDDPEAPGAEDRLTKSIDAVLGEISNTSDRLGIMYIEIGNKYSRLEDTETRLTKLSTELKEAYTDKLGADPYEAIMEMYYHRYSYNAALQVSSNLMGSSLFDFMR